MDRKRDHRSAGGWVDRLLHNRGPEQGRHGREYGRLGNWAHIIDGSGLGPLPIAVLLGRRDEAWGHPERQGGPGRLCLQR